MTVFNDTVTLARVNELLTYDPATGEFRWRVSRRGARAGDLVGYLRPDGYRVIMIDRHRYYAHRLAWFVTNGEWPPEHIDHIDGDPLNNRIDNLRPATNTENSRNRGSHTNNSSSRLGVYLDARNGNWHAKICVSRKQIHLGSFKTRDEAVAARQAAEILYFKEFRRAA